MACQNPVYEFVTPEVFQDLRSRYDQFLVNLDKDAPVIKVHTPLRKTQLDQLAVIREVSKELQQKKDEDILKAKQAAEEASKAAAEQAQKENSEEVAEKEETPEDTEKKDAN